MARFTSAVPWLCDVQSLMLVALWDLLLVEDTSPLALTPPIRLHFGISDLPRARTFQPHFLEHFADPLLEASGDKYFHRTACCVFGYSHGDHHALPDHAAQDIGFLRSLPKLTRISYTENAKAGWIPDKTAAEFWNDWDAKKK